MCSRFTSPLHRLGLLLIVLGGLSPSLVAHAGQATPLTALPFIPDPPPQIDGSLARLEQLSAGWHTLEKQDDVVWGGHAWTGPADLSARIFAGWDRSALYVAAKIQDDHVLQPYHGTEMWRGDHVMVMLDLPRQPAQYRQVQQVIHLGLSPGDLANPQASPPAAFRWQPDAQALPEVRVAARRIAGGYQIEAAIPWSSLKVTAPLEGLRLGLDVILSDAENQPPSQKALMSLVPLQEAPWRLRDPDRLRETVLGDATGQIDPALVAAEFVPEVEDLHIEPGQSQTWTLPASATPVQELILRAHLEAPRPMGGAHAITVLLNGQKLEFDRLLNRLPQFDLGTLEITTYSPRHGYFSLYTPDQTPPDPRGLYGVRGLNPFEWRWDVQDLWKSDAPNTLEIRHTRPTVPRALRGAWGLSERLSPRVEAPRLRPAPEGELPVFEPRVEATPAFTVAATAGGALQLQLGRHTWQLNSGFSTTAPGWARFGDAGDTSSWLAFRQDGERIEAHTQHYAVHRSWRREADRVVVVDRIENLTDTDQPVMVHHAVATGPDRTRTQLGGLTVQGPTHTSANGAAPTALALYEDAGLGLVREDDLLRAGGESFFENENLGLRHRHLVVRAGHAVELEFSLYPLETADPFLLINRIRRHWDTNFTIPGGFSFMRFRGPAGLENFDPQRVEQFIRNRSVRFSSSAIPIYKPGIFAHGTALPRSPSIEKETEYNHALKSLGLPIERLMYFHSFLSVSPDDAERFAADRHLLSDGSHANYGRPIYPMFVPRSGSAFAKALEETIDFRYAMGADGIYWDEMSYSAHKYDHHPDHWDGYTAIIDPDTHRITRKISNVILATLDWRLQAAENMLARGPLIANWQPETRTFTRLQFPRFVETGTITAMVRGQLYTPIALGDHLTERTAVDCHRIMLRALDYGGLYYWYTDLTEVPEPMLTEHMFPATPIELGPGFLIARERILTKESGSFGWGDASDFTAHVYDRRGRKTEAIAIPRVEREGRSFAEVRIPEGYAVALVRQPAPSSK